MLPTFAGWAYGSAAALSIAVTAMAAVPPPPANQNTGMVDGVFNDLVEADCRFCHEDPGTGSDPAYIPNRHHNLVNGPIQTGICSVYGTSCVSDQDCDASIEEACLGGTVATDTDSDNDGQSDTSYQCLNCHIEQTTGGTVELLVFRDCLVCHVQQPGEASVHHLTATAQGLDSPLGDPAIGDCTPCHGSAVDDSGDGHFIPDYSPTARTPTPSGGTAYPINSRGNGAGACDFCHDDDGLAPGELGKVVYTNQETHHGTGLAADAGKCNWCHDFGVPYEDQIRVCEACHGPDALHAIQTDSDGDNVITPGVEAPSYGHIGDPDDCWGCHGFALSAAAGTGPVVPHIDDIDQQVLVSGSDATVTVSGSAFTNMSEGVELTSQVAFVPASGGPTTFVPDAISEKSLTVTIPGTTAPGNYRLRAVKDKEQSNPVVIAVVPQVVIADVSCNRKKGELTITGLGFGDKPAGTDAYIYVEVNGKTASVISWSDVQIKASVSGCVKRPFVTVNALHGSGTYDGGSSGVGGDKPPKPCNGKKC